MFKNIIMYIFIIISLNSCTLNEKKELKVSVSNWIGYSPILYAKEKNWLQKENIKILNVVSISENLYLFKAFNSDAFTGTQYEFNLAKEQFPSLTSLMLFDRSNGGDIIMGNMAIDQYKKTDKINTYLEIDSVNSILLENFLNKYNIDKNKINYINKNQSYITSIENHENLSPTLLISYIPYNFELEKNGFLYLDSTYNNIDLLVIDGLFTKKETYLNHKEQFEVLKEKIDLAIKNLKNDPEEYYKTIQKYFEDISYEDFISSLNDIVWIDKNSKDIIKKLEEQNFYTKDLIR